VRYEPNDKNWRELRESDPGTYWRQGLYIGHLDRLLDAMVMIESASRRPMNFGEFETAIRSNDDFKAVCGEAREIFIGFDFRSRPVLGRLLLTYACLMHSLMSIYRKKPEDVDLPKLTSVDSRGTSKSYAGGAKAIRTFSLSFSHTSKIGLSKPQCRVDM
jgi:hypothetical protein